MREMDFYFTIENIDTEILEEVYEILKEKGKKDPELSHILESKVKDLVIEKIALYEISQEETIEMCKVLYKIGKLDFPRWFA